MNPWGDACPTQQSNLFSRDKPRQRHSFHKVRAKAFSWIRQPCLERKKAILRETLKLVWIVSNITRKMPSYPDSKKKKHVPNSQNGVGHYDSKSYSMWYLYVYVSLSLSIQYMNIYIYIILYLYERYDLQIYCIWFIYHISYII